MVGPRRHHELDELFAKADALMDRGQRRRAFDLFMRGAVAGDVSCASRVGVHLSNGEGAPRDVAGALRWLRRAYRGGSTSDAENIAMVHAECGRWDLAVRWWRRAVQAGERSAGIQLSLCLLEGRGVRRAPREAWSLLQRVARMSPPNGVSGEDYDLAMALLGVMAATGTGTRKDLRAARRWLARANADGDYPAAERVLRELGSRAPSPLDVAPPWWVELVTSKRR